MDQREPPPGAIQFSRDVWVYPPPAAYRTDIYIAAGQPPRWEHCHDSTPCDHGSGLPEGEWVPVDLPLSCLGHSSHPRWPKVRTVLDRQPARLQLTRSA